MMPIYDAHWRPTLLSANQANRAIVNSEHLCYYCTNNISILPATRKVTASKNTDGGEETCGEGPVLPKGAHDERAC